MQSKSSTSRMKNLRLAIEQHPLFFFIFFTYAFSWIISIPFILSEWGVITGNYQIAIVHKGFGPFLIAFLMIRILDGQEGIKRLRQRIRDWKKGWLWYVLY